MSKQKREDYEMKRKIKAMEDQARSEAMASAPVKMIQPDGENQGKMSFDQWWMLSQGRMKLRPHLKEIIWADMQSRGLAKQEPQEKYDAALRLFGYSW